MLTIDFSTSNANGGTQYVIADLSTGLQNALSKRVIVTSSITNAVLSDSGILPVSQNPIVLDASGWPVIDRAVISVQLGYAEQGTAGNAVTKGYIAPLTLNLPS